MSFVHVASTTWTCERFLTEVSFNMKFKFNKCLKDIATMFTYKFANCPLKSNTAWFMHSNRLDVTLWSNRYNFVSSTGWRASQWFPSGVRCSLLTGTVWQHTLWDRHKINWQQTRPKHCYALHISGFLEYNIIFYFYTRWSHGIKVTKELYSYGLSS
jgi:hypothetical protein